MQQSNTSRIAPIRRALFISIFAGATISLAAPPTITNLGLLPGGTYSRGGVVSPNGLVVTGVADIHTDEQYNRVLLI